MKRHLLSLALLAGLLCVSTAASAQSLSFGSIMGGSWGGTASGTGQAIGSAQFAAPMGSYLSLPGQTGQIGSPVSATATAGANATGFWSLMPMFQFFGF